MTGNPLQAPAGQSLAQKLALAMLACIALLGVSFLLAGPTLLSISLHEEYEAKATAITQNLASNLVDPLLTDHFVRVQLLLSNSVTEAKGGDIIYAFLSNKQGEVVAHTFAGGFPSGLKALAASPSRTGPVTIETEKGLIHDIAEPVMGGEFGTVHLGQHLRGVETKIRRMQKVLIGLCLAASGVAVLAAILLARKVTRPLKHLVAGAERIGSGDLAHRVPVEAADEVGILAGTFNRMAQALQDDIRRRQATEESLRQSEAIYRTLVENIDFNVALLGTDYTMRMVNAALSLLVGKTPGELQGRKCHQEIFGADAPCALCPVLRARETGTPQWKIMEINLTGGSTAILKVNIFPLLDADGAVDGYIEVMEDVTVQQQMQARMENARRLESIAILAGGLVHDFNNLLTVIVGHMGLAKMFAGENNKVLENLNKAENATLEARGLTKRLLGLSRGNAPQQMPTPMEEILRGSMNVAVSGSSVHCTFQLPSDLWAALIDSLQIQQVIENIGANAVQAMPEGGVIEVSAANALLDAAAAPGGAAGNYVRVTITDHGAGIPPENLDKIFEPYFSTKNTFSQKGRGLGLTTCYAIIKQHGGAIAVRSTVDVGTTVEIFLPAADSTRA